MKKLVSQSGMDPLVNGITIWAWVNAKETLSSIVNKMEYELRIVEYLNIIWSVIIRLPIPCLKDEASLKSLPIPHPLEQ